MVVLEVGKTYNTRGGGTVTLISLDYAYSRPFFGKIYKDGALQRPAGFYTHGYYYAEKESEFDIVSELTPSHPQQ